MRQWRLIYDSPTPGARNMAVDAALLGAEVPTLRLYGWSPACLSLGYGQRARVVDAARLAEAGWDIVRRPTGGRAILHVDELTYSLALPADHPVAEGGILASYQRISQALQAGLRHLGVLSQADAQTQPNDILNPVCFETPSHYEITFGGKKLIGSAQVRRKSGVLQHGSLPLGGALTRICDVLAYPDEAERQAAKQAVQAHATTVSAVLGGQPVAWETAAQALISGFEEGFGIALQPDVLTSQELLEADRLTEQVYGNPDWTFRR